MGFRYLVSLLPAILVTGRLALALPGLSPTEHASLSWTHGFEPVFQSRLPLVPSAPAPAQPDAPAAPASQPATHAASFACRPSK